jgi:16S rRNA (guanine1207-N2)-methyltransferase
VHALSQFYQRNAGRLAAQGPVLWLNPPADLPWQALLQSERGDELFSQDFSTFRQLARGGSNARFDDFPDPATRWQTIILTAPREKDRLDMLLRCCAALLAPAGSVWLAGENKAGGKSAANPARALFRQVDKIDSARHCTLYKAALPLRDEPFDPTRFERRWSLPATSSLPALEVCSWPGVFAHGHLDAGTQLLLEHLPAPAAGSRVLDFGCGAGILGARLAQAQPKLDLLMADSNALALRSARATLSANELAGEVLASDGFSELEGRFDLVISNPPFHLGHLNVTDLSMTLLAPVRRYLQPGGELLLVANRHLPYQRWLDDTFGGHEVRAIHDGFHILACRNR